VRREGNGRPCHQEALFSPPKCHYHAALDAGRMSDSYGKWHAEPRERPKMLVSDDGWKQADADVFEWLAAMPGWGPI
jgi:hypothetical protein